MLPVSSNRARRWWLAMPSSISNCTRSSASFLRRQHQAVGQREQIVRRDAEPHGGEVLRLHALVQHPQIVGVGFELGFVRRLRPAANAGLDALGLHVGAFHDANRDRRAAGRDALAGPLVDPLLRGERIGDVRLQGDAGAGLLEAAADRASA